MWESKIIVEPTIQQKIENSAILTPKEKENFLRHLYYFTNEEKRELALMI